MSEKPTEGEKTWQEERDSLKGEISALTTKLDKAAADLAKLAEKPSADPAALTAAQAAVTELRAELKEAKDELAALKAHKPEPNSPQPPPPPPPPPPSGGGDPPKAPPEPKARKNQRAWI